MDKSNTYHQSNTGHQDNTGHPSPPPQEDMFPSSPIFLPTFPDHGVVARNLVPAHQAEGNQNTPAFIVGDISGTVYESDDYYDDEWGDEEWDFGSKMIEIFGGSSETSGNLMVIDPDPGENIFQTPGSLAGLYGTFTFNPNSGDWTYELDNNLEVVDNLESEDVLNDYLSVQSLDGSASALITITIIGVSDGYVIFA